jgi:nucleotide-binding universal stress UspA family protein
VNVRCVQDVRRMMKIKTILCPVDFFPASIWAVNYAARLASSNKAGVYLLHVMTPVIDDPYSYSPYSQQLIKSVRQRSTDEMQTVEQRVRKAGIVASSRLRVGNVYDEIVREIRRLKPDLVVMGTHGRSGVKRWFLGSIAEKLLRHCPVPLLVVSAAQEKPIAPRFRRILVTTDLSEGTTGALACAQALAEKEKSQITLLHVVHDLAADVSGDYRGALLSGVKQYLDGLARAQTRKQYDILTAVDVGRADRIIPRRVRSNKVDLLIMSIQDKSILDRALYGSTAEQVVRAGGCPVLLVPLMRKKIRAGVSGSKKAKAKAS